MYGHVPKYDTKVVIAISQGAGVMAQSIRLAAAHLT